MTKILNKIFYILLLCTLLTSCSQKRAAPIVLRTDTIYDRYSSHNKDKYQNYSQNQHSYRQRTNLTNTNTIIVAKGDTVYDIAKKYKILIRDLIDENNLEPPYILRIGDKLSLPQDKYHIVENGDNLYDISRKYGMNINNLIALNNLEKPYTIKAGEKLKIANSTSANNSDTQIRQAQVTRFGKVELNNNFIWPVKGEIISTFGHKSGGLYNDGINIKTTSGQLVKAVQKGTVAYTGNELKGYGNLIIIKHDNNWISAYAHLNQIKVMQGSVVQKGGIIGTVGTTGNVSYPQLYFGLRQGRRAVNPIQYLKS